MYATSARSTAPSTERSSGYDVPPASARAVVDSNILVRGILRRHASAAVRVFDALVAAALEGDADYLVTDDRHDLLPLKVIRVSGYRPVQLVAPGPFVKYVLG